jgi:peptidoglycan/LPS O-acetylase OafA/YrhL
MRKLKHFEGLRGVAAFIVFIAHFRPTFCVDINKKFLDAVGVFSETGRAVVENFISLFYEGTLPVYIFWFMSAYVISIKLYDKNRNENNRYLVEASTKRYFRLFIPVFFASLLAFILMKSHLMFNVRLADYFGSGYKDNWLGLWYNFDPGIIHFLRTTIVEVFINDNSNYNIALWTMTPELMGSMLCFGLFAVMGKNKMRFAAYLLLCFFLMIGGLRDTIMFYYLVFTLGLMWCDAIHSTDEEIYLKNKIKKIFESKATPVILLIIGFAATIFSDTIYKLPVNLYYLFTFPVKAIGFTLLVNNFDIIQRIFSTRAMTFMGKISFSFYLLHIPIMFSLGIYMYLYGGIDSHYKLLIIFLMLFAITVLFSYLFMKFIDKKAIYFSDKIGKYFSGKQF